MDILQEIVASLMHNRLRTILTGLSVSWGIFILIVFLGAGNGLSNGVQHNFNDRATNSVQMWSGKSSIPYLGLQANRPLDFAEQQISDIGDHLAEPDKKTGIIERPSVITYKTGFANCTLLGVDPSYKEIFNLKIDSVGRFINAIDSQENSKVAVIDKKIAKLLFNNKLALGKYIKIGPIMFRVIGINSGDAEQFGNPICYIPFTTDQLIYDPDHKFNSIAMTVHGLRTKAENDTFNSKLTRVMAHSLHFDPNDEQAIYVYNAQRQYLQTMKIFDGITLFVAIVGIFTLLSGIIGVSNIMLVSVKEHTREIGIRKAIGASPVSILRSIIIESVLLTGGFGYFGIAAGVGLIELVNYILQQTIGNSASDNGMTIFLNPTVSLTYVLLSTIILIVSGMIAGYIPARRAIRIKPVEAMREG